MKGNLEGSTDRTNRLNDEEIIWQYVRTHSNDYLTVPHKRHPRWVYHRCPIIKIRLLA